MAFRTDPSEFTHRATLYGLPCYYREDGEHGCDLMGTNVVSDWLLMWYPQAMHWLACRVLGPIDSPDGWPIQLRGEL